MTKSTIVVASYEEWWKCVQTAIHSDLNRLGTKEEFHPIGEPSERMLWQHFWNNGGLEFAKNVVTFLSPHPIAG